MVVILVMNREQAKFFSGKFTPAASAHPREPQLHFNVTTILSILSFCPNSQNSSIVFQVLTWYDFKLLAKRAVSRGNNTTKGELGMKNVEMTVEGNTLQIKVDLSKEFGPSSSGKTIIIASTEGNVSIPGAEEKRIGLNVYRKK